jgi:hypothetical protein
VVGKEVYKLVTIETERDIATCRAASSSKGKGVVWCADRNFGTNSREGRLRFSRPSLCLTPSSQAEIVSSNDTYCLQVIAAEDATGRAAARSTPLA